MFKQDSHHYVSHCIPGSLLGCLIGTSNLTCPKQALESFQSALLPIYPALVVIIQAENWRIIHISSLHFLTFHIQYNSKSYSLTCMLNVDCSTTSLQFSSLSPNKTPYSYYHPLCGWLLNGIPASTLRPLKLILFRAAKEIFKK